MFKALWVALSFSLSFQAFSQEENLYTCRATSIFDDNYFEEGLSIEEYPDISVTQTSKGHEVMIGAHSYESGRTTKIQLKTTATGSVLSITRKTEIIRLVFTGVMYRESGTIWVDEKGKKSRRIATFDCSKQLN